MHEGKHLESEQAFYTSTVEAQNSTANCAVRRRKTMTPPPLRAHSVDGSIPVCGLSQHGSHTYIKAYLLSMVITACLCIEKSFVFNLCWMLQGFVWSFCSSLFVTNRRQWFCCCRRRHRTWYKIGHISVSLRFKI